MSTTTLASAFDNLRTNLDAAVEKFDLSDTEQEFAIASNARRRARNDFRAGSRLATAALVDDDGLLRWEYDPPPISSRRRARRGGLIGHPDVVHSFQFVEPHPNEFTQKLEDLDHKLTPCRGLRQWVQGKDTALSAPTIKDPVLLLIHGTFSKSDMFLQEFAAAPNNAGASFVAAAEKNYKAVLTFDHPTLSVGPWLNALDLAQQMKNVTGPIDVICHSRGGLVTAWWLFHAAPKVRNVIFVGSPLAGTSLAAPNRLKAALDLLANLARAIGTLANVSSTALPMLAVTGGLFKLIGGMLSFGSSSPLLDAGINLVPGLSAQSHVTNNFEIQRLFAADWGSNFKLHAVMSDFEPQAVNDPIWKFWKYWRRMPATIADAGADFIFGGPNDLVVDTASMCMFGKSSLTGLSFDKAKSVHHCAYFRNPETLDFLTATLGL
jgi:pimeloyl-ACP methyl ester carboxylesterase